VVLFMSLWGRELRDWVHVFRTLSPWCQCRTTAPGAEASSARWGRRLANSTCRGCPAIPFACRAFGAVGQPAGGAGGWHAVSRWSTAGQHATRARLATMSATGSDRPVPPGRTTAARTCQPVTTVTAPAGRCANERLSKSLLPPSPWPGIISGAAPSPTSARPRSPSPSPTSSAGSTGTQSSTGKGKGPRQRACRSLPLSAGEALKGVRRPGRHPPHRWGRRRRRGRFRAAQRRVSPPVPAPTSGSPTVQRECEPSHRDTCRGAIRQDMERGERQREWSLR
jgi:hypothetical protein